MEKSAERRFFLAVGSVPRNKELKDSPPGNTVLSGSDAALFDDF